MSKVTAQKLNMSQIFDEQGKVIPVTYIKLDKPLPPEVELGISVKVRGTTKGKGFAGVMKRWGFSGGPATRGQSDRGRAPGSIGSQGVNRVHKGKKMPGRLGGTKITIKGLRLITIDEDRSVISVSGSIPGHYKSRLSLTL